MTESNQGPATPGTAARCEVCNREKVAWTGYDNGWQPAEGACWRDPDDDDDSTCYRRGYERLKAENASLLESLREARACIEFDPPSDAAQIIARLRLIVENHNKQCGDFVTERNSAWRRLIEMGKAKKAAEQRAEAAEKADSVKTREINILTREVRAAEERADDLTDLLCDLLNYRRHRSDCAIDATEFCTCGLREIAVRARAALHDEEPQTTEVTREVVKEAFGESGSPVLDRASKQGAEPGARTGTDRLVDAARDRPPDQVLEGSGRGVPEKVLDERHAARLDEERPPLKRHKCMRCGGEFACRTAGCTANYDVLPRIVQRAPDGSLEVVEHECHKSDEERSAPPQTEEK